MAGFGSWYQCQSCLMCRSACHCETLLSFGAARNVAHLTVDITGQRVDPSICEMGIRIFNVSTSKPTLSTPYCVVIYGRHYTASYIRIYFGDLLKMTNSVERVKCIQTVRVESLY